MLISVVNDTWEGIETFDQTKYKTIKKNLIKKQNSLEFQNISFMNHKQNSFKENTSNPVSIFLVRV